MIFAVRELLPVFAATLYTIFPFPFPLAVFTVSHEADDFALQATFAVTPSSLLLAAAAVKLRELAASVRVVACTDPVRNTFEPATTFPVPFAVYWTPPYLSEADPTGSQKRNLPPTGYRSFTPYHEGFMPEIETAPVPETAKSHGYTLVELCADEV